MRVLKKSYGPKRDQGIGSGEDCVMRSFMTCTSRMWVLKKAYGPKRDQGIGSGEDCVMRSFMTCTPCQTLFR